MSKMTISFKRNRKVGKPLTVKFVIPTYDAFVAPQIGNNFPMDRRNCNLGNSVNDAYHENAFTKMHSVYCSAIQKA